MPFIVVHRCRSEVGRWTGVCVYMYVCVCVCNVGNVHNVCNVGIVRNVCM